VDPRAYYDDFAGWYERERQRPYHRLLDDLEIELVRRHGEGRAVLEVGCGTGLLLGRIAGFARRAVGVDLSAGMLARARARGLDVVQGSATALPFADGAFDLACAFKVLAHVPELDVALAELARVTRPGGWVLAELYGAHSLRRLIKLAKRPHPVSPTTTDDAVFTAYHSARQARALLPPTLRYHGLRGIRVVTPAAWLHEVPGLGRALRAGERVLADLPSARRLGGFLVVIAQRV
jgi:ubiquinone/menaquinone biosynthesis C-methylase UbiE